MVSALKVAHGKFCTWKKPLWTPSLPGAFGSNVIPGMWYKGCGLCVCIIALCFDRHWCEPIKKEKRLKSIALHNVICFPVALRFSPLGCGAARVHPSAPPRVVCSGTLRSSLIPFLPVAFYAHDVCSTVIQWARLLLRARCELFFGGGNEDRTLFLVFRWWSNAGSVPVIIPRGGHSRFFFLFLSFFFFFFFFVSSSSFSSRLVFQQKCGTRVRSAASAECSPRSRPLDWRGIPAPFPSPAPRGTRGVCMQTVVYHGKVREAVSLWLLVLGRKK